MKILCETQTVNRQTQACVSAKTPKATLVIGFNKKCVDKTCTGEQKKLLELVHFTPIWKEGKRYKITNNLDKIYTKFLQDGKATISFKEPPENLMIKCDPIQLKSFLQAMKLGIEGKDSVNLRLNTAIVTAIPQRSQQLQKMSVLKRSDYPIKGFPKSLKKLTVSGIQLMKVSFEVCSLRNLTMLDLSDNKITKIPIELGRLALTEFFVQNNSLGEANSWHWLAGKYIQKSLRNLDMSNNKIEYFPHEIVRLDQLVTLKLNNNNIQRVPFALRRLRNLRIFHISTNRLESLPSLFNDIRLDELDVWGNSFQLPIDHRSMSSEVRTTPQPLWLLAANAVCRHKLAYTTATLPWLLVDIISESPQCACGKLCFESSILKRAVILNFTNCRHMIFDRRFVIHGDVVFCGPNCIGRRAMHSLFDQYFVGD